MEKDNHTKEQEPEVTSSGNDSAPNPVADASNRLCLDVLAETWGRKSSDSPSRLKEIYTNELKLKDPSPQELNKAWFDQMTNWYAKQYGRTKAEEIMSNLRKSSNCT